MDDLVTNDVAVACQPQRPKVGTANAWLGYLASLAATVALLLLAYGGIVAALDRVGSLPPPAITNELCADEKLHWLRGNFPDRPNLLVVGSSIAWRDIDSSQFARRTPGVRPLNAGFCYSAVSESAFVANYLLDRLPSLRSVVAVVVPQDFTRCTRSQLFDPAIADSYFFGHRWLWSFYFTQFDPISLTRNAFHIRAMREARDRFNPLEMTAYGDGPLRISGTRGLMYGRFTGYDPACFAALRSLAGSVTAGGRRFFVITGPVHPDWYALHGASGAVRSDMLAGIEVALGDIDGTRLWDGAAEFGGKPSEFTDALHINWGAAQRFSTLVAEALDKDIISAIERHRADEASDRNGGRR
jgi:hypothetical protein